MVFEDVVGQRRHFEGDGEKILIAPTRDGKYFAANFPDMAAAPLYDAAGGQKGATKIIIFVEGHKKTMTRFSLYFNDCWIEVTVS